MQWIIKKGIVNKSAWKDAKFTKRVSRTYRTNQNYIGSYRTVHDHEQTYKNTKKDLKDLTGLYKTIQGHYGTLQTKQEHFEPYNSKQDHIGSKQTLHCHKEPFKTYTRIIRVVKVHTEPKEWQGIGPWELALEKFHPHHLKRPYMTKQCHTGLIIYTIQENTNHTEPYEILQDNQNYTRSHRAMQDQTGRIYMTA